MWSGETEFQGVCRVPMEAVTKVMGDPQLLGAKVTGKSQGQGEL